MRISRSLVGEREAEALARVVLSDGYLGMGSEVKAFEEELAAFIGVSVDNVVCVSSGTAALHLAIEAAVPPGGEVLVQSLTFLSSFQAISGGRAVPIGCEVYEHDFTIDLDDARGRVTEDTRAIMPVHYASYPGDLDAIYAFADEFGLRVIEDAAHAFGCTHRGKRIGSFGDICCFSFDGIKNITSGEGGAVVTGDPAVAKRVRDARLLGIEDDTEKRNAGQRSWEFDVRHQGYRYHMSNLFGALGRVQLKRFEGEFAPKRIALARRYRHRLSGLQDVRLLRTDLGAVVPHIQPVRIVGGSRDRVLCALARAGIQFGIHYMPNHQLSFYGGGSSSLPLTERLMTEAVSLPLHPGLENEDVDQVCRIIEQMLTDGVDD